MTDSDVTTRTAAGYMPTARNTVVPADTFAHLVGRTRGGDYVLEYMSGGSSLHRWRPAVFAAAWEFATVSWPVREEVPATDP